MVANGQSWKGRQGLKPCAFRAGFGMAEEAAEKVLLVILSEAKNLSVNWT
jgi:hypothetical protein